MLKDFIAEKLRLRKTTIALRLAGAAVVLLVFYALSLPALTAEGDPTCGLEEHTHTDACYEDVLICGYPEDPAQGAPDPGNTSGSGISGDPENADPGNTSGSGISGDPSGDPGTEPHVHTAACYEKVLVCNLPEHTHSEACYGRGLMMSMFGTQSVGDPGSDLSNFLDDGNVVIRDKNNNIIGDSTDDIADVVVVGESYTIKFTFNEIYGDRQFEYGDSYLTYKLPNAIKIPSMQTGVVKYRGITPVGNYEIDTNGLVKVNFNDVDNSGASTPGINYIDNYENAEFDLTLTARFNSNTSGGEQQIDFGGSVIITVTVNSHPDLRLDVTKTVGAYDPLTRKIPYTITVTPINGMLKDIVLDDLMRIYTYSGISGDNMLSIDGNVKVTWKDSVTGATITGTVMPSHSASADTSFNCGQYEISLNGVVLPDESTKDVILLDGETVKLEYTTIVDEELHGKTEVGDGYNIHNKVIATGMSGNEELTGEATCNTSPGFSHLQKYGILSENDDIYDGRGVADDEIRWRVIVGDGSTDLRGKTIVDALGPDLEILPYTIYIWLCSDVADGWLDEASNNDIIISKYMGSAAGIISGFNAATGFNVNVPNIGEEVRRVYIEYKVTITNTRDDGYSNTVSIDDGKFAETGVVGVYTGSYVTKNGKIVETGAGEGYIEYTIRADVAKKEYTDGNVIRLVDILTFAGGKDSGYPIYNASVNMSVSIKTFSSNTYDYGVDYTCSWEQDASDKSKAYINFDFNDNDKWQVAEDSVVTVTYRIPFTQTVLDGYYKDKTLYEALMRDIVANTVELESNNSWRHGAGYVLRWPIFKEGVKAYCDEDSEEMIWEGQPGYSDTNFYANVGAKKGYRYSVTINSDPDNSPFAIAPDGANFLPVFSDSFESTHFDLDKDSVVLRLDAGWAKRSIPIPSADITTDVPGEFSFEFEKALKDYISYYEFGNNVKDGRNYTFYVEYVLLFKGNAEAALNYYEDFDNTASLEIIRDSVEYIYRATEQVDYTKPIAEKTMGVDGTVVDVEIIINPDKEDLASGSVITVIDTMKYLILPDNDITKIKVKIGDAAAVTWPDVDISYDPAENIITFTGLPDEEVIKITYKTEVDAELGETVTISNSVCIGGHEDNEIKVENTFEVVESSGGADGSKAEFTVFKTDAETELLQLAGATFALYSENLYNDAETPSQGVASYVGFADKTYCYFMSETTDGIGEALFENPHIIPGNSYLLVETEAPAGYLKPDFANSKLIWIYDNDDVLYEDAPAGTYPVPAGGWITVYNETGVRFPESGGAGERAYMIGGAALMVLAAGVLLILR
ncbi:MAG: hypothetical protein LBL49_05170, partial [Clostridiales Family XIII bacterium]|nr:hypothetical protein [Clostridiales Family XIII bacterium]